MTGATTLPWPAGITQERALDLLLEYAAMIGGADAPASDRKVLALAFDDWRLGERSRGRQTVIPESDLETALSQAVLAIRGAS